MSYLPILPTNIAHLPLEVLICCAESQGLEVPTELLGDPSDLPWTIAHYLRQSQAEVITLKTCKNVAVDLSLDNFYCDDYSLIGRMVNPRECWSMEALSSVWSWVGKLLLGLNGLISGEDFNPLQHLPSSQLEVGWPTTSKPYVCTPGLLGAVLHWYKIPLPICSSTEDMLVWVEMLYQPPQYLAQLARDIIYGSSTEQLVSLLQSSKILETTDFKFAKSDFNSLSQSWTVLQDLRLSWQGLRPSNPNMCVALAALNYGLDLSTARDPRREYSRKWEMEETYTPKEEPLCSLFKLNREGFDLSQSFNPIFPLEYYQIRGEEVLPNLAKKFGFQSLTPASTYSTLTNLSRTHNFFYRGVRVSPLDKLGELRTVVDLQTVMDKTSNNIFTYGNLTQGNLVYFTSEELLRYLSSEGWKDPFGTTYSTLALQGLLNIMNGAGSDKGLSEAINGLLAEEASVQDSLDTSQLQAYKMLLGKFLEVSMYCRGWGGPGNPYPLTGQESGNHPQPNLEEVSISLTQFLSLENCQLITDLYLHERKAGKCFRVRHPEKGITVGDRIRIIGENDSNFACLMASSNLFLATISHYNKLLGIPQSFDIQRVTDMY